VPQPIDLQTELGRVTQVERVQQVLDRASLAAQQRLAASAQESRLQVETQVQQTQTTSEQVEKEARRRNPYVRRKRSASGQTVEDVEPAAPGSAANAGDNPVIGGDDEGNTLDISV